MLNLTQPQYVMPMHGDHKRLRLHGELAEAVGIRRGRSSGARTACRSRSTRRGARFGEREQAGMIFVDGMEVGDIEDVALRDRRMLSADGIFIVVATVSEQDGRSVVPPEIIFRGVPFPTRATASWTTSATRWTPRSARSAKEQISGDRPPPGPPARRRGRVRLRPAAPRPMVLPVVVEV